jgi:hypothetical protein
LKIIKPALVSLALMLSAVPAIAGTAKTVTVEDALNGRVPVAVATEGGGTILDFSPTGEIIHKLTIDDPSKVGIDHCLMLRNCTADTAPIVRLFRIEIPNPDIPRAKTTQLTVITRTRDGEWNSYIFPVMATNQPVAHTKFLVGGEVPSNSQPETYSTIALGAQSAQTNKTLVDPVLMGRVKTYLFLRKRGMSSGKAAKKANISRNLVNRLDALGKVRLAQLEAQRQAKADELPPAPPLPKVEPLDPLPAETTPKSLPQQQQPPTPQRSSPLLRVSAPIKVKPAPNQPASSSSTVAAVPANKSESSSPNALDVANYLQMGIRVAESNDQIRYRSKLWNRLNNAIRYFRQNHSSKPNLARAARKAGVSEAVLREYLAKGGLIQ